jgi:hypothetical protein
MEQQSSSFRSQQHEELDILSLRLAYQAVITASSQQSGEPIYHAYQEAVSAFANTLLTKDARPLRLVKRSNKASPRTQKMLSGNTRLSKNSASKKQTSAEQPVQTHNTLKHFFQDMKDELKSDIKQWVGTAVENYQHQNRVVINQQMTTQQTQISALTDTLETLGNRIKLTASQTTQHNNAKLEQLAHRINKIGNQAEQRNQQVHTLLQQQQAHITKTMSLQIKQLMDQQAHYQATLQTQQNQLAQTLDINLQQMAKQQNAHHISEKLTRHRLATLEKQILQQQQSLVTNYFSTEPEQQAAETETQYADMSQNIPELAEPFLPIQPEEISTIESSHQETFSTLCQPKPWQPGGKLPNKVINKIKKGQKQKPLPLQANSFQAVVNTLEKTSSQQPSTYNNTVPVPIRELSFALQAQQENNALNNRGQDNTMEDSLNDLHFQDDRDALMASLKEPEPWFTHILSQPKLAAALVGFAMISISLYGMGGYWFSQRQSFPGIADVLTSLNKNSLDGEITPNTPNVEATEGNILLASETSEPAWAATDMMQTTHVATGRPDPFAPLVTDKPLPEPEKPKDPIEGLSFTGLVGSKQPNKQVAIMQITDALLGSSNTLIKRVGESFPVNGHSVKLTRVNSNTLSLVVEGHTRSIPITPYQDINIGTATAINQSTNSTVESALQKLQTEATPSLPGAVSNNY